MLSVLLGLLEEMEAVPGSVMDTVLRALVMAPAPGGSGKGPVDPQAAASAQRCGRGCVGLPRYGCRVARGVRCSGPLQPQVLLLCELLSNCTLTCVTAGWRHGCCCPHARTASAAPSSATSFRCSGGRDRRRASRLQPARRAARRLQAAAAAGPRTP